MILVAGVVGVMTPAAVAPAVREDVAVAGSGRTVVVEVRGRVGVILLKRCDRSGTVVPVCWQYGSNNCSILVAVAGVLVLEYSCRVELRLAQCTVQQSYCCTVG